LYFFGSNEELILYNGFRW